MTPIEYMAKHKNKFIIIIFALLFGPLAYALIVTEFSDSIISINQKLNSMKKVDRYCVTDEDCKISSLDCLPCGGISQGKMGAVKKDYEPFCPLWHGLLLCPAVRYSWSKINVSCIYNKCQSELEQVSEFKDYLSIVKQYD